MRNPNSLYARALVAYYGLIEVVHSIVLIRAGLEFLATGSVGFPAPPPPGGWSAQATHFLIATGAMDGVNIVLAFLFVYGTFRRPGWRLLPWLGAVTLTATACSALVFAYGTVASGAWAHHPGTYLGMTAVFIPVGFLILLFPTWIGAGPFDRDLDSRV
jgi:hypothetical protein